MMLLVKGATFAAAVVLLLMAVFPPYDVARAAALSPEATPANAIKFRFISPAGLPQEPLLIQDAHSLFSWKKKLTPQSCQNLCMTLQGCNTWALCNNKAGCGTGCKDFAAKYIPLAKDTSGVGKPYRSLTIPIQRVGYWTQPRPGRNGCAPDAAGRTTDKWAHGSCRLMAATDPSKPKVAPKAQGAGWVSGSFVPDPKCKTMLSSVCYACATATNPGSCRFCSYLFPIPNNMRVSTMLAPEAWGPALNQTACLKCARMPYSNTTGNCIQCVARKQPCSQCAILPYEPGTARTPAPELASCIDCAYDSKLLPGQEWYDTRSEVCKKCASRPAAMHKQCMSCLTHPQQVLCPHDSMEVVNVTTYGPCSSPSSVLFSCDTCFGDNAEQCGRCMQAQGGLECLSCVYSREQPSWGEECRDCVLKGQKGCGICILDWGFEQACVDCVNDESVLAPGICPRCVSFYVDSSFCHDCIRDSSVTDFSTCDKSIEYPDYYRHK